MSIADSLLTGAAHPITFYGKDGRKEIFHATPLEDVQICELDNWVQARYIENARRSLRPDTTQKERDETLSIAMRTAAELSAFSGLGARMLSTTEGMAQLVCVMLKNSHPNIKVEYIRKLMFSQDNIRQANLIFKKLNIPELDKSKPGAQKKVSKRKQFLKGESTEN